MRRRGLTLACTVAALAACGRATSAPTPGSPDDLAATLRSLAGADEPTRARAAAAWQLDEPTWNHTLVPLYRPLYADYTSSFPSAIAPVVAALATRGAITARQHYAEDPRLTRAQQRMRWGLPTLYPSAVAELDGHPLDAVFVYDGARWRALAGVDEHVLARVHTSDAACAARLALAGPAGSCTDVGYTIAAAALRGDQAALARACALATTLCANRSP